MKHRPRNLNTVRDMLSPLIPSKQNKLVYILTALEPRQRTEISHNFHQLAMDRKSDLTPSLSDHFIETRNTSALRTSPCPLVQPNSWEPSTGSYKHHTSTSGVAGRPNSKNEKSRAGHIPFSTSTSSPYLSAGRPQRTE